MHGEPTVNEVRRPARLAPLVVCGLVLTACAVLVGYLIGAARTPGELSAPKLGRTFPLTSETFDDARTVTLSVSTRSMPEVRATVAGVVTGNRCRPEQAVTSGSVTWSVNGRGLLNLHLAEPPYRDLVMGASGRDVMLLQRELIRLGADADTSGRFDASTLEAVNEVRTRATLPRASGLLRSDVVWLAAPRLEVRSCDTALGAAVGTGTTLAQPSPTVVGVRVDDPPQTLVAGDRLLRVDDVSVPLAEGSLRVTEQASIADILGTRTARLASEGDYREPPLSATFELAKGIAVVSVPASAVIVDSMACVVDETGGAHLVDVVSSSLGRSVVRFHEAAEPARVLIDPDVRNCAH